MTKSAEAFAERIGGVLNDGAIALMLSLGHRTRLFDSLATLPPSRSEAIAAAAGLDERYVREWLAAMVTGGILDFDPKTQTYSLPEDHARCLTRDGDLGNLAVYAQFLPMAGAVQEEILARFRDGKGLSYAEYPCFHAIMAEDSAQTVVAQLFESVLPLADGLTARLEAGIDVLDAGCGSGRALLAMAERYPQSRFTGYDLSAEAIDTAKAAGRQAGLDNLHVAVRDLSHFDEEEGYDLVTSFDAVHDQRDPANLIRRLHRALRPGSLYLMQDVAGSARLENNRDFPMAAYLYTVSTFHCMPVSLGQGGQGLGTMWGWETAEALLQQAGFSEIKRHILEHDPMNVWFVSEKG